MSGKQNKDGLVQNKQAHVDTVVGRREDCVGSIHVSKPSLFTRVLCVMGVGPRRGKSSSLRLTLSAITL